MEQADPSSPSHLLKHLEALEKARDKCQQKLQATLQEAIDGVEQLGASGSSSSANPPSKKQKSLEKDIAQEGRRGKMGFRAKAVLTPAEEVLEKAHKKEEEEVVLKKTKSGWEEVVVPKTKVLEKTKGHKMPKAQDLEESKGQDLEKSKGKPVVVVNWRNTLEIQEEVSGRNSYALEMLLHKCQVVLLSFVQSAKREKKVLEDMAKLPQAEKLAMW